MKNPLEGPAAREALKDVIIRADELDIRSILIPFFDRNEVASADELSSRLFSLIPAFDEAKRRNVIIGLETPLPAHDLLRVLSDLRHSNVRVYYDIGNATGLGFDVVTEVGMLGPMIAGVHVKDRVRGGGSVPLGKGGVDLASALAAVRRAGYIGPLVLETPRAEQPAITLARYRGMVQSALAQTNSVTADRSGDR